MFKVRLIFVFVMSILINISSYADIYGKIKPEKGAKNVTIYTLPGFDYQLCESFKECDKVAWPSAGEEVKIISAINVTQTKKAAPLKYYLVEYISPVGPKKGYVEKRLIDSPFEPEVCLEHSLTELVKTGQDVLEIATAAHLSESIDILGNRKKFSPKCEKFLTEEGILGPWGQQVVDSLALADLEYIRDNGKSCFYNTIAPEYICPNFKKFNLEKKKLFWAYTYASIAQIESSCRTEAQAKGTNGTADGLLQLEYAQKLRRASGRDPVLCATRKGVDTQDTKFQFECSASIFRDVQCDRVSRCENTYANVGTESEKQRLVKKCIKNRDKLSYRGGYWEKLRGKNGAISKLIKEFPGCSN